MTKPGTSAAWRHAIAISAVSASRKTLRKLNEAGEFAAKTSDRNQQAGKAIWPGVPGVFEGRNLMLFLDLRNGERFTVDGPAVVTVSECRHDRVRLAIEAGAEVKIETGKPQVADRKPCKSRRRRVG